MKDLESLIVDKLSYYRDPAHLNNLCTNETMSICREYGEPDVMDKYYPSILLGFDQAYYSMPYQVNLGPAKYIRIARSNEERLVPEGQTFANFQLRKTWDTVQ